MSPSTSISGAGSIGGTSLDPLVLYSRPPRTPRASVERPAPGRADRARDIRMTAQPPQISIVIPIYNEEGILHAAVVDLRERLAPLGWNYEIILAENGSRDRTVAIAQELSAKYPEVRSLSIGEPNYGKALKQGILESHGEYVICDE